MNEQRAHLSTVAELLLCLSGPLIWAAQFFVLYGAVTLACLNTAAPLNATFFAFAVAVTLVTLLAVAGLTAWQVSRIGRQARAGAEADGARFLRAVSIGLGGAAVLAILWGTLPLLVLPACAGAP
jgi:hypothetical protein